MGAKRRHGDVDIFPVGFLRVTGMSPGTGPAGGGAGVVAASR